LRLAFRLLVSFAGVAVVTFVGYRIVPVNATTEGFAYLLLVLVIASTWGFLEAALSSVPAALLFNFFFFPPVGTLAIEDPQNWVALFSFLSASLIASRLSAIAKRRALEAVERQQEMERLYTFSRAILLIGKADPFSSQLVVKLVEIFKLSGATLYNRRDDQFYDAGNSDLDGIRDRIRDAAFHGTSFEVPERRQLIVPVRLGSEIVASLALQGGAMSNSAVQGVVSLVAIGLERARAHELEEEAAVQNEHLRTAIIDAMAHEFKTPLTLIKGMTTALLANPHETAASRIEQLTIADEEADHLRELIDNASELARLDTTQIDVHPEPYDLRDIIGEVILTLRSEVEDRQLDIHCDEELPLVSFDPRLIKLAIKQLINNALKYAPPDKPVTVRVHAAPRSASNPSTQEKPPTAVDQGITSDKLDSNGMLLIEVTDYGPGIPPEEQMRVFERFYRSPSVKNQIPGSGLGLSIAHRIVHAHDGELKVMSRPGQTTFQLVLPIDITGDCE
jgi:two-component system sensor histidine kinase KdpD